MKLFDRFSAKEKRWAYLTLAVATAAILYSLALEPHGKGRVYSNRKTQATAAALKKSLKSLSGYDAMRTEYQRLAKEVPSLKGGEDTTESLGLLEKIASESSVFIVSVKPQVVEAEEGSKSIFLDVAARGTAQNLVHFLYRLENSPHLLHVRRLTVSPRQNTQELEANLILKQLASL